MAGVLPSRGASQERSHQTSIYIHNPQDIRKRSLGRALRGAARGEPARYRGRPLEPPGLPKGPVPRPAGKIRGVRGGVPRCKILTYSTAHLSRFLWFEFKSFLAGPALKYDAVMIQETHWGKSARFSVAGWTAITSSGRDKADGVAVFVHPKYARESVRYAEVVEGRVLRVQVALAASRLEVICVYRHVWSGKGSVDTCRDKRRSVLRKLGTAIRQVPARDTLIVGGDFNSGILKSPGLVGPAVLPLVGWGT